MKIKRLSSLALFAGVVLFSYAAANAQETTTPPPTAPKVVVTDPLDKPATPAAQPVKPTSTTTKIGNYSVNVTEGVTGINLDNGRFLTITKWDGSKWVTKREWVPNKAPATKPNQ